MDIDSFVREREPRWRHFERLLDEAERMQDRRFAPDKIQELVRRYRQTCSDLNHARSLTADPVLLDRLNQLAGRGYRYVYRDTRREGFWASAADLFLRDVPATFRQERGRIGVAAGCMLAGVLFGFVAVMANPHRVRDFLPDMFFAESARDRVKKIEEGKERIDSVEKAAQFSTFLLTHNIQVSFLAFSLGALSILGGAWILFHNGIILGVVTAQYTLEGVATFFVAWVGPHGALELPAIIFAGAAGMKLGQAFLLPGDSTRAESLRAAFPGIRHMMLGAAAILVLAGIIEGSFSQFSSKTVPYGVKIAFASVMFVFLVLYLFVGRRSR